MDSRELLVIRYNQLIKCSVNASAENLVNCSAELRAVLMDKNPLLDVVNAGCRIKIKFVVGVSVKDIHDEMQITIFPHIHFINAFPQKELRHEVSKDQFLKFKIGCHAGVYFSVGSLIKIYANKLGGVHFDGDEDVEVDKIKEYSKLLSLIGVNSWYPSLVFIARITSNALRPLITKVSNGR